MTDEEISGLRNMTTRERIAATMRWVRRLGLFSAVPLGADGAECVHVGPGGIAVEVGAQWYAWRTYGGGMWKAATVLATEADAVMFVAVER